MNLEEVLSKLNAAPAAPEPIDWDAPESGQFPPRLLPGIYDFVFKLPDDADKQFDIVTIQGSGYLTVIHEAEIADPKDASKPVKLNFCRANTYKHEKMAISGMGDLLRSLGLRTPSNPPSNEEIISTLQAASGTTRGRAEIGWKRYCKACDQTVSTHPRKQDVKWPRNADKTPILTVACPGCGDRGFGREELVRYKLPEKAASA